MIIHLMAGLEPHGQDNTRIAQACSTQHASAAFMAGWRCWGSCKTQDLKVSKKLAAKCAAEIGLPSGFVGSWIGLCFTY